MFKKTKIRNVDFHLWMPDLLNFDLKIGFLMPKSVL